MRYLSTRGGSEPVSFVQAMVAGLASDGGLYVPETIPMLPDGWGDWGYEDAMAGALELFGAIDVDTAVIGAGARFEHAEIAPIVPVADRHVLELFWGPTLSFKDHAMQVVARLLDRAVEKGTVLGATSGDTGSAAIEACRQSKHLDIVVLFPEGRVSEFQRRQMTTVTDDNVRAVAVRGTFDDCQALVKEAFSKRDDLLAINSINWARIAAQVGYYIHVGVRMEEPFDVVVPTGNFGNVYSCWLAKQIGVPIETIVISNNANHALADLVATGTMNPGSVVATTAPSMDIQVPSNLERFTANPTIEFVAGWSTDDQIRETIEGVYHKHGYLMDTHTATAWRAGTATKTDRPQLVVATAHPAKFSDAVGAAIGHQPEWPDRFQRMFELPERMIEIDPKPSELLELIR